MDRKASELDFLKWFWENADFGPADGDVRYLMKDQFRKETGAEVPEGYDDE